MASRPPESPTTVMAEPAPEPAPERVAAARTAERVGRAESFRVVAGVAAVLTGLAALLILAVVAAALVHGDTQSVVTVATSAFAVIGSIVGAYFGVKEGTSGTEQAVEGMKEQATRAQAFAAHVPSSEAGTALLHAQGLVAGTLPLPFTITPVRGPLIIEPTIFPSEGPPGTPFAIVDPDGRMTGTPPISFAPAAGPPPTFTVTDARIRDDGTLATGTVPIDLEPGTYAVTVSGLRLEYAVNE